ncbi:MAG: zinc ribbon domain-containing protein, partial [Micropruina sp.]|uniref:double zinc ribbon domain-containing protein n=1 Tax=Micropruina sp. TaxID=2737536 RepID=UPI0039E56473
MNDDNPAWPLWVTEHDAANLAVNQEYGTLSLAAPCPQCGMPVRPDERYCENCGADVHPEVAGVPAEARTSEATVKLNRPRPAAAPCLECGGAVDADGYCQTCGAKAPSARDHFEAAPASWLGGVCDRGVVHSRNEDAMALWAAAEPQRSGVLVVCDGVSSSQDSDVVALAAAERARDVLADAVRQRAGAESGGP